jgi:hypothetical protein
LAAASLLIGSISLFVAYEAHDNAQQSLANANMSLENAKQSLAHAKQSLANAWLNQCTKAMQRQPEANSGFNPPFRELCKQEFGLDLPKGGLDQDLYRQYRNDPSLVERHTQSEKEAWAKYLRQNP